MDHSYFSSLRQGSVLELAGPGGLFVVVSQTCDVVQPKRELLQLAPLVRLGDPEVQRGARKKANPRYPLVHDAEEPLFADLSNIQSVKKTAVLDTVVRKDLGFPSDTDAREFGLAVARWFGRFAFPDNIQPWLAPVQELIRDKYEKPNAPFGQVLQAVSEVRVEADSWSAYPANLTLHVVVEAGSLPSIPEDADLSDIGIIPTDLNAVCSAILDEQSPTRRTVLWAAFAQALAERCVPKGRSSNNEAVLGAVSSIVGEVASDDEFPLSKVRKSEQLDVDYLSDPAPY